MARRRDFNGQAKAIGAGVVNVLTWTASEIASERVVAYHVVLTGGNTLAQIDRIRLSANGGNIWNISRNELRALWNSMSGTSFDLAGAQDRFTIPLYLMDAPTPDQQDVCQFPSKSQVQLEIVTNATALAGNAFVAWTETDVNPVLFPRYLGQAMNISAGAANQRFNFSENGVVMGYFVDLVGLDRLRFVIGQNVIDNLPGVAFSGVATGDALLEVESIYGVNGPLTTFMFEHVQLGIPAPADGSFIELTTQAAVWAGVANELGIYALAPNGPQAAG